MIVFAALVVLIGCQSAKIGLGLNSAPSIEFTDVPLAGGDNPGKMSVISGRVRGAQSGQQIVIYAKGATTWWVQPYANQPFTKIESNSEWSSTTHPGTEYAALLVNADFQPLPTTNELPTTGVFAFAITKGELAFWHRWWFPPLCLIVTAVLILGAHRFRVRQMSKQLNLRFEERLAERTKVARELHDTLLQGVLSASMQLHVAVDQLPEDSPARPPLNRILQLMGQVIDEGRNTLRGLRSASETTSDLKTSFLRIPEELGSPKGVDFRVVVEGQSIPVRFPIRDEIYSIGREALVNAFRHSHANTIDIQLEYGASELRVLVRDNGCGIEPQVLDSGRDGHWGLSGMRERAAKIGAKLKVLSRSGAGTEVELRVPGNIAFESRSSSSGSRRIPGSPARHEKGSESEPRQRA